MTDTEATEMVVGRLKAYTAMKRRVEQLHFELGHSNIIGEKELIECMALGAHTEGQSNSGGNHLSDRTMAIALRYRDDISKMNKETIIEVYKDLSYLEMEVKRLEYYVSLLAESEASVIRLMYFERKPWETIEKVLYISRQTIYRRRKKAVGELADMYSLACVVGIPEKPK